MQTPCTLCMWKQMLDNPCALDADSDAINYAMREQACNNAIIHHSCICIQSGSLQTCSTRMQTRQSTCKSRDLTRRDPMKSCSFVCAHSSCVQQWYSKR